MTITIPSGRTLPLQTKAGGGYESSGAVPPVSNADFSYFENFEGLTKNAKFSEAYNLSVTSSNPIIINGNYQQVVSLDDPIAGMAESPPYAPENPKVVAADPGAGRTGNSINAAISFPYTGTASSDGEETQYWTMNTEFLNGAAGLSEFWMQYDEYIPANFVHRDSATIDDGRKILAFWADYYSTKDPADSNYDPTLIVGGTGYTPSGSAVRGTVFDMAFTLPGVTDPSVTNYNFYGVRSNPPIPAADLILVHPDIDRGHWQRRTMHVRLPTALGATDGIIEFWVQRQRETASPPPPEKLANWVSGDYGSGDWYTENQNYLNNGYLLGYANAGFGEDTTFLITNWIISSSVDDIDQTAIN